MLKKICLAIGLLSVIIACVALLQGESVLADAQDVAFTTADGDILNGTFYPGASPYGVVLVHGFSGSETMMRPLAVEFAQAGIHVLTFNFSGHGDSESGLTFDNAQRDRMALQVAHATEFLRDRAKISLENVILIGHSMGARAILEMATTYPSLSVAGIVLLGAQVNVATNTQSEFFTGTSDTGLDWVKSLDDVTPRTNVHIITGAWDDILTPDNSRLLLQTLLSDTTDTITSDQVAFGDIGQMSYRALTIVPNQIHNYEIYDASIIALTYDTAMRFFWTNPYLLPRDDEYLRPLWWLMGIAGIIMSMACAISLLPPAIFNTVNVSITHIKRFVGMKALLWLLALPIFAILTGIFFFVPLPTPIFNLLYGGFLGAYGLLLFGLYRMGRMPATQGRILSESLGHFVGDKAKTSSIAIRWIEERYVVIIGGILALALTAIFANTGWFSLPLSPVRIVWLILFTPLTALGFWIGHYENALLTQAGAHRLTHGMVVLIGLLPFYLYALLLGALGSVSGLVGAVNGLVILMGVVLFGEVLLRFKQHVWSVAIMQSIVLYWLVLPQSALFIR